MSGCSYEHAGCDAPDGGCAGFCTHRIDSSRLTAPVRVVMGNTDTATPAQRALATWRLYRRFRCGVRESFRSAMRSWRAAA